MDLTFQALASSPPSPPLPDAVDTATDQTGFDSIFNCYDRVDSGHLDALRPGFTRGLFDGSWRRMQKGIAAARPEDAAVFYDDAITELSVQRYRGPANHTQLELRAAQVAREFCKFLQQTQIQQPTIDHAYSALFKLKEWGLKKETVALATLCVLAISNSHSTDTACLRERYEKLKDLILEATKPQSNGSQTSDSLPPLVASRALLYVLVCAKVIKVALTPDTVRRALDHMETCARIICVISETQKTAQNAMAAAIALSNLANATHEYLDGQTDGRAHLREVETLDCALLKLEEAQDLRFPNEWFAKSIFIDLSIRAASALDLAAEGLRAESQIDDDTYYSYRKKAAQCLDPAVDNFRDMTETERLRHLRRTQRTLTELQMAGTPNETMERLHIMAQKYFQRVAVRPPNEFATSGEAKHLFAVAQIQSDPVKFEHAARLFKSVGKFEYARAAMTRAALLWMERAERETSYEILMFASKDFLEAEATREAVEIAGYLVAELARAKGHGSPYLTARECQAREPEIERMIELILRHRIGLPAHIDDLPSGPLPNTIEGLLNEIGAASGETQNTDITFERVIEQLAETMSLIRSERYAQLVRELNILAKIAANNPKIMGSNAWALINDYLKFRAGYLTGKEHTTPLTKEALAEFLQKKCEDRYKRHPAKRTSAVQEVLRCLATLEM